MFFLARAAALNAFHDRMADARVELWSCAIAAARFCTCKVFDLIIMFVIVFGLLLRHCAQYLSNVPLPLPAIRAASLFPAAWVCLLFMSVIGASHPI